jgi:hypothetical protein
MKTLISTIGGVFATIPVIGGIAYIGIIIAAIIGWFMNIVKMFAPLADIMAGDGGLNLMLALRLVGIPLGPLGAILGWM